jgi:hypothetical protein
MLTAPAHACLRALWPAADRQPELAHDEVWPLASAHTFI